jgi:hypothetical protein
MVRQDCTEAKPEIACHNKCLNVVQLGAHRSVGQGHIGQSVRGTSISRSGAHRSVGQVHIGQSVRGTSISRSGAHRSVGQGRIDQSVRGTSVSWSGAHRSVGQGRIDQSVRGTSVSQSGVHRSDGQGRIGQSVRDASISRSGEHCPRDASSKGRIVQGTEHPRLFVWGYIGHGHIGIASLHQTGLFQFFLFLSPSLFLSWTVSSQRTLP